MIAQMHPILKTGIVLALVALQALSGMALA